MNNYTKEELEEILNNYTNEDIYQNMIIRLPDGTGAPLQEIQNRYNDLVNEETVEETVDIESMSIDELLDLYSKNVNSKSEINSSANSLFSYGITSEELTEIFNIDNLQSLIVNEIKRKYDLSESFRNMTDEELLSLRVTASSDLERLTVQVMDSGEAATNTDENLKNQLLEQIKDIDNEINFRKKQVELREKMLKILNNQNININTLDKINPNDPHLQLDENEIDSFIFEKNKLDLMNDIFTNRDLEETKEVINSNKENKEIDSLSIEELLNLYVKNLERIDDLNFKGDLSLDDKNVLQDLKNSQNKIKEILTDKLSLNEELKDLSIEELNNLKDKTYDDLSNLINPVMDSGMAADNEDLALKDKLTGRLKEIASELEYRNLQKKK